MGRGDFANALFTQDEVYEIVPRAKANVIPYTSVSLNTIPASDSVSVLESSTSLKVAFTAPQETHGAEVESYLVEWWDTSSSPEVQEITITGGSNPIHGAYLTTTTSPISYLLTPLQMSCALLWRH